MENLNGGKIMSFKAMSWAASTKTHTPIQKLILLLLADRANDDGFCFPSMKTIAEDACMSRSAVMENVKKLAAQGLINVTKRTITDEESGKARNTSNLYHLNTGVVVLPDGGSRLERLGVVAQDDNSNLSIEPINEPIESGGDRKQPNSPDSEQNKSNKKPSSSKKSFVPPTIDEALAWGKEKKYPPSLVRQAWEYYNRLGWQDSRGNKVKAWKNKIIAVWMTPEKIKSAKPEPVKRGGITV